MAKKMTQAEIRKIAKERALTEIQFSKNFENAGQDAFAVPIMVDDTEVWVEVKITAKNWYDTARSKAYDPFLEEEQWQMTLSDRNAKAEEVRKKKEAKIKKSKGE